MHEASVTMTKKGAAVSLECRLRGPGVGWDIYATWEHSLRERIQDLVFISKQDADHWIRSESASWIARGGQSIPPRTDGSRNQMQKEDDAKPSISTDADQARRTEIHSLHNDLTRLSEKIEVAARRDRVSRTSARTSSLI
jgi:hypothetical protein